VTGKQGKIERWRGRAELHIESKDFKAAGDLIGRLQDSLQLEGVNFTVSPEARRAKENALITEAVAAFRQRAELAQKAFGAQGYELVNVSINTAGQGPVVPVARGLMMKAEMADAVAPEFAAGESQIQVTVGGTVELKP
jgi:predicted secreted protein